MTDKISTLRFNGSVWCNLDVALRSVDQLFKQIIRPANLAVIEWYILRSLYEEDGQHASALARAVGRAATSFTPNLDKLQNKGFLERRPDPSDRRAVRIYLTPAGQQQRQAVLESSKELDALINDLFSQEEFEIFLNVLAKLQSLSPDQ